MKRDVIHRLRAVIAALAEQQPASVETAALMREVDQHLLAIESESSAADTSLAAIAEELRAPISSILGWTTMLRDGRSEPTFAAKGLDVIERSARAQQRIIDDVLARSPSSTRSPPALRTREKRLAHLCVLVVEDEVDSRELIELLLASEGASVRCAGSAMEALELLDAVAPDVVLSDIGMPGRDGYWLAAEVRARRPDIAAIALTAFSARDDVERAIAAGFDHHVAKPVDPEELVRALTVCPHRAA